MAVAVKNLVQTRAGGIHVTLEPSGKVTREEAYFSFKLTWLGKQHEADVTADRYMASHWNGDQKLEDRLTDWRVIVRSRYGDLTDAARRAADAQIEPIVLDWLRSPECVTARQTAYAHAIARAINDERYDAARAMRVLQMHADELRATDLGRLRRACTLLADLLESLVDPA